MTEKTKVYVDPYRKKYGSPTMPSQKKGYDRKEKVKAMNELARETTKQIEEEQSIDDLIQEAKAEGNFNLASELIDKRIQDEHSKEFDVMWDRQNIKSGGRLDGSRSALEILQNLKSSGELDEMEESFREKRRNK
jgi:uncharacterized protein YpuA (DUF1002 family)